MGKHRVGDCMRLGRRGRGGGLRTDKMRLPEHQSSALRDQCEERSAQSSRSQSWYHKAPGGLVHACIVPTTRRRLAEAEATAPYIQYESFDHHVFIEGRSGWARNSYCVVYPGWSFQPGTAQVHRVMDGVAAARYGCVAKATGRPGNKDKCRSCSCTMDVPV